MPLLKQRRVLAGKLETTMGTPATLSAGDVIPGVSDVQIDDEIPIHERMVWGGFGEFPGVPGAYKGALKFKVEASGSGTNGTPPLWANVCLASSGFGTATAGLFSTVSAFSAQHSATFQVSIDGVMKQLAGSMGKPVFTGENGKPGVWEFTYSGIWHAVTDVAMPTPVFPAAPPPRFAAAILTFAGGTATATASKLSTDIGTTVDLREDFTQTSGYVSAVITGRKVTGTLDPEATLVATRDDFGTFLSGGTASLSCTIGGLYGYTMTANAIQYREVKEGDRGGKVTSNIKFASVTVGTVDGDFQIQF
jgi:hypothetical protein